MAATKARKSKTKAELDQQVKDLQAQVAALKSQSKKGGSMQSKNYRFGWKQPVIWLSTIIAVLLVVAGNMFFWAGNTVIKQDRYVAATTPIIKNTNVQHAVALYTTNQIFNNFDVEKFTEQVLPPRAQFLAPTLSAQVKSQTQSLLQKGLANPQIQDKWNQIQAKQHQRVITFITNYQGNGKLTLNDFYQKLSSSLSSTKLSFLANKTLPPKIGSITVMNATWLPTAHRIVTKIDVWRDMAILLAVALLALAVWLSKTRRQVLYMFSVSTIVGMLVSLVSLRAIREDIVGKVDPQYADGVRSAIEIFTHSFVVQTVTIMFVAALVGIIAWISGNSKGATKLKKQTVYLMSGKIHQSMLGNSTNKFVMTVQKRKRLIEWIGVAVIAIVMLLARLTPKSVILYAIILVIYILAVEIIGADNKPATKK